MAVVYCSIDYVGTGRVPQISARCPKTGVETEAIYGDGPRSVRRALAMLASQCPCGCFHRDASELRRRRIGTKGPRT